MAGANWQALLERHPLGSKTDSPDFWEEYLGEHPDVLNRLLADLYQATYGAERPPTLDDVWEMVSSPRFTSDDFGPAVLDLLSQRDRSIRWLAQQTGTSHTQVRFYLTGKRPILNLHDTQGSMIRIEAIARALRVHPSYFAEWRRLWIMTLLDSAFAARPGLSVGVFKRFAGFEQRPARAAAAPARASRPHVNGRSHRETA